MLNIEKYKNDIQDGIRMCGLYKSIYKIKNGEYDNDCCGNCHECYDRCIRWLAEEYEEPVLDEVERKYLSDVIKPFRKKISCIRKSKDPRKGKNYIKIEFCDGDRMFFPNLSNDAMYKGMELDKKYSLEELGL